MTHYTTLQSRCVFVTAAAVTVLGFLNELSAGIIFSASNATPVANVFESFDVVTNNFNYTMARSSTGTWYNGTPLWTETGQSFFIDEPTAMNLDKLTLRAGSLGTGTGLLGSNYTLEIWQMSGALDSVGDTLVSSQSGTFPTLGSDMGGNPETTPVLWTFDLDDITLASGSHYGFLLGFDSQADDRYTHFAYSFGSGYAGGRHLAQVDGSWDPITNSKDMMFYLQGTAVPEPSTVTLILIVAGTAFGRNRLRRMRAIARNESV